MMKRRHLGNYNNLITRQAVYETDSAIEVDAQENFEIVRKRVFFEDVLLVTMHETVGLLAIFFTLGFASFLLFIAAITGGGAGVIMAVLALPILGYGIARMARKDTVITVFGRRSKAQIRMPLRQGRAHRLYAEICERVRNTQADAGQALSSSQSAEEVVVHDLDQDDSIRQG